MIIQKTAFTFLERAARFRPAIVNGLSREDPTGPRHTPRRHLRPESYGRDVRHDVDIRERRIRGDVRDGRKISRRDPSGNLAPRGAGFHERDPTKPKQRCALLQSRWRNEGSEARPDDERPECTARRASAVPLKAESMDEERGARRSL